MLLLLLLLPRPPAATAAAANQGRWLKRHPFSYAVDVATAAAAELQEKHGAKKVGMQG
jgi:hypothetical protein